jgi:hypothetical protein
MSLLLINKLHKIYGCKKRKTNMKICYNDEYKQKAKTTQPLGLLIGNGLNCKKPCKTHFAKSKHNIFNNNVHHISRKKRAARYDVSFTLPLNNDMIYNIMG